MAKTKKLQELGQWKVGQPVLIQGRMIEAIRPIERITDGREGTIYVCGDSYDIHGRQRGGDIYWSYKNISIATQEDLDRIRGKNAQNQLKRFQWSNLKPEDAIKIRDELKEKYGLDFPLNT